MAKKKREISELKKAGRATQLAINLGSKKQAVWSGGFHVAYSPDTFDMMTGTNKFDPLDFVPGHPPVTVENRRRYGYPFPGPGPHIFLGPLGIMYGFDEQGEQIVITDSSTSKMSNNLKKIYKYGEGPVLCTDVSKGQGIGLSKSVVFAAGHGGQSWVPYECNNGQQYNQIFSGANQLGVEEGSRTGAYKVGGMTGWSVSNLSSNIFENDGKPYSTIDDKWGAAEDTIINVGFNILVSGLEEVGEAMLAAATGGASELVMAAASPLIQQGVTAISDEASKEFTDLIGLRAQQTGYTQMEDFFAGAQSPGVEISRTPDNNFLKDDRVRAAKTQYYIQYDKLQDEIGKMKLPDPELSSSKNKKKLERAQHIEDMLNSRDDEFDIPDQFAKDDREYNRDVLHYQDLAKSVAKIEYAQTSIHSVDQTLQTMDGLKKLGWDKNMNVDNRGQNNDMVMAYLLPGKYSDVQHYDTDLRQVQSTASAFDKKFNLDVLAKKESVRGLYEKFLDKSLAIDGWSGMRMMEHVLTDNDKEMWKKFVDKGWVKDNPAELYKFKQDKIRAFRNWQMGADIDFESTFEKSPENEYLFNKLYDGDKKNRFQKYFKLDYFNRDEDTKKDAHRIDEIEAAINNQYMEYIQPGEMQHQADELQRRTKEARDKKAYEAAHPEEDFRGDISGLLPTEQDYQDNYELEKSYVDELKARIAPHTWTGADMWTNPDKIVPKSFNADQRKEMARWLKTKVTGVETKQTLYLKDKYEPPKKENPAFGSLMRGMRETINKINENKKIIKH